MIGAYSRGTASPDYPWGPSREESDAFLDRIRDAWGGPDIADRVVTLEQWAPSRAHDQAFRKWWGNYLRNGATPASALVLARMNGALDVRDALPLISVPALLLHRLGDRVRPVEAAREIAACMPSARLVELPGEDHLPFVGDQDAITDEIERFVAGGHAASLSSPRSMAVGASHLLSR